MKSGPVSIKRFDTPLIAPTARKALRKAPRARLIGPECVEGWVGLWDALTNTLLIHQSSRVGWGGCRCYAAPCNQDLAPVPQLAGRAVLLNEVRCIKVVEINTGQGDGAVGMGDLGIARAIIANGDRAVVDIKKVGTVFKVGDGVIAKA